MFIRERSQVGITFGTTCSCVREMSEMNRKFLIFSYQNFFNNLHEAAQKQCIFNVNTSLIFIYLNLISEHNVISIVEDNLMAWRIFPKLILLYNIIFMTR